MSYYTEGYIQTINTTTNKVNFTLKPISSYEIIQSDRNDKHYILFLSEGNKEPKLRPLKNIENMQSKGVECYLSIDNMSDKQMNTLVLPLLQAKLNQIRVRIKTVQPKGNASVECSEIILL